MTGQAGKVGRGLRSIGANIAKLATDAGELEYTVNGVTKSISLFDETTGDMKNTYQVLSEISEDWDKMSKAEQSTLAIAQAGKTQIDVYTSVMSNFDTAINATNTSINSQGSAMEENSKYMESMGAKLNALKAQFQELVLGDGGLNTFLKGLIDLGTGILKVINDIGGLSTILISLIGILITLKGEAVLGGIVSIFSKLPILLNNVGAIFLALTTKGASLSLTLKNIGISASIAQLALGALTAVITIGAIAWNKYKQAQEDAKNSALDNINSLDSYTSSLQSTIDKINDESTSKSALIDIASKLDSSYDSEKAQLKDINELRQEAIDKLYEEAQAKAKETIRETGAQYQKSKDYLSSTITSKSGVPISGTPEEVYKGMGEQLDYYNQKVQEGEEISKAGQRAAQSLADEYSSLGTNIKDATTIVDGYDEAQKTSNQSQEEWLNTAKESSDSTQSQSDELQSLAEQYNLTSEQIDAISQAMENSDASAYEIAESLGYIKDETNQAKEALEEYKDALSELSSMDDAFITLNDAIAEYNSSGEFTLDTLDNLLSLGDEYLALLEFENGQVSLNKDGALALANAKIDEAEATAVQKAMAELNALAQNDEASAIDNASASASASYSANMTAVSGVNQAIIACNKGVTAWNNYWSAQSKKVISNGANASKANEIGKSLNNQIQSLESLRGNLGKVTTATTTNTKATRGSTGATKSNTSAMDANKKALEAQKKALEAQKKALENQKKAIEDSINDYERVISYLEDKVNDYIDELEEAKDKELAVVDQQIDAIKEKQDAEDKYWEDKINALKEQNDALEDQIELQELLDNLAKAKANKKMVYREGQGFVYEADQQEVSKAQQELNDYYRKKSYEDQLKQLEDFRDSANENYEQQIKDLEDYQKEIEKKYENQIQYYKDWIEDFKTQVDKYKDEQDRLLALQLTGIDTEQANWTTRLTNLGSFVDSYTTKLSELDTVQSKIDALETAIESLQTAINSLDYSNLDHSVGSGGGGGGGNSSSTTTSQGRYKATVTYNGSHPVAWNGSHYQAGDVVKEFTDTSPSALNSTLQSFLKKYQSAFLNGLQTTGIHAYASGTIGTENDGIALVGDNPNYNELVIGSKLNGAKMLNMSSNTGVIPHNLTSTLIQMASSFNDGMMNLQPNNTSNATNVSIGNISLPSVQNGQDFVDYLQNFSANMTQLAYSRI